MSLALIGICCNGSDADRDPPDDGNVLDSVQPTNGDDDDNTGDTGNPDDNGSTRLDLGHEDPDDDSDCKDEDGYEFNVIWVANSQEGTVSKIDTVTAEELARYRTGPGEDSLSPSRTSVNMRGDVAVANRAGSLIKIAEKAELCDDANGDGLETSTGPDDVLPWGEDECVLWEHEIEFDPTPPLHDGGIRAVAWDFDRSSDPDEDVDCYGRPNVWIGWRDVPSDNVILRRVFGHNGETDNEVVIEDWQGHWNHGAYGGAIDPDNNFWALGTMGTMVRVDSETFETERWDHPDDLQLYGIAIDADGTPWMASYLGIIWKFDVEDEEFVEVHSIARADQPRAMRGLAIDEEGHAWIAGNVGCGLLRFDTTDEEMVDENIKLENCVEPVGVSIDAAGKVWVVDRLADHAYRVDPDDYDTKLVRGLVAPYTYSDMTGAGLGLVIPPIE